MSPLRVYNTLRRQVEPFEPQTPHHVKMYVCGMTVYDYCHIGHARAMLSFDVVYRWLLERGYTVEFVRNYTDVDDKIIQRAAELGEAPLALSARFIEALDTDLARMGLALPTVQPRVSEHIPDILQLIAALVARDHAYVADDGSVYFAVESFPTYGALSGKRLDDLRAGERVSIDNRKRHPGDFVLWKATKEGEDGATWESPWGPGRPGWHIECSAMSIRYLGETFDIHGGGIDLLFPHHENELAQSECATGHQPFARYWLHNGHLNILTRDASGENQQIKMSKSLGNIIRIRDILDQVPAEALRLVYLETHYRSPMPYSADRLTEAVTALDRLYQAREALEQAAALPASETVPQLLLAYGDPATELHQLTQGFAVRFGEAMDDDFNAARALSVLWDLVRAVNRFFALKKAPRRGAALAGPALVAFDTVGRVLGIAGQPALGWFEGLKALHRARVGLTEDDIQQRIAARDQARREKDYARGDGIRQELVALGVSLMDTPQGTTWRVRVE